MTTNRCDKEQYDISAHLPFWDRLTEEHRRSLRACSLKRYAAGERLLFLACDRNGYLLVLRGDVRVYISSPGGREFTLYHAQAGQFCALLPMDGQGTPTLEAYRETLLYHITLDMVLPILSYCPEAAVYFLSSIGRNTQSVIRNIERSYFSPLRSSIASKLLESRDESGDTAHITHEQIANHFGTTREVVSRELEGFRDMGLISCGRGRVKLLDIAGLESLAAE